MNGLPLLGHACLDDVFAWRPAGPVSVREFLADVAGLAAQLPEASFLLNLCQDRYRFAVGFAAGLLTGKTSLQPASQSIETLRQIQAAYAGLCCLCDSEFDTLDLPRFGFPADFAVDRAKVSEIPRIPADQIAAILFTSGSTGLPQAHGRTWGRMVISAQVEAVRLGLQERPHHVVGTVPVQHSFGFESTLLLALHGGCPFWSGKPFYPQDIVAALSAVPSPRLLVTTPFHLAALLAAELEFPAIDLLLSATAPLSAALALKAENCLQAPVMEIYGSTESGHLASRRTRVDSLWQLMPDVQFIQEDGQTIASGGHVEGRVPLSDVIEICPDGRFILHGRHADLVNIAGKRTSLAYLNHQIGAIAGVLDAAFFLPDDETPDGITRLCAFVVAPGLNRRQLLAELRQRIDPVFLPRPLILLDALPRNSTGKLPRKHLQLLYAEKVSHADR